MNLIVLTEEQRAQVDTDIIKGVANVSPANTFRYNMDKLEHISSILSLEDIQIMDSADIVMWEDNE